MANSYIVSVLFVIINAIVTIYICSSFSTNNSAPLWFLTNNSPSQSTNAPPPGIYIFGDSTADVGTNDYIQDNSFRANVTPYGIDFDDAKPSGRFSNGYITVDFICQLMGFKRSPPPFLLLSSIRSEHERNKFKGVNFASAGSGLLDTTATAMNIVPISKQVDQFIKVRSHLVAWMGTQSAVNDRLSKSIFLVSIGTNDISQHFDTNSTIPNEQLIHDLMTTYETNIKLLYDLGARNFGIISVLPMGCLPSIRATNVIGGCIDFMNDIALNFYMELDTLLFKIRSELLGFKYSLGNTYRIMLDAIQNPAQYNFVNVDTSCCGSGKLNAEEACGPTANLCENRKEYVFWDEVHPTETAAQLGASMLYSGGIRYASPINFAQLVEES